MSNIHTHGLITKKTVPSRIVIPFFLFLTTMKRTRESVDPAAAARVAVVLSRGLSDKVRIVCEKTNTSLDAFEDVIVPKMIVGMYVYGFFSTTYRSV